jgi:phosphohistidine phosphatase SixA
MEMIKMKGLVRLLLMVAITPAFANVKAQNKNKSEGPSKIFIIRHGEKPDKGGNLNCEGLNRAMQLADVLHQKIGTPDYIYVPAITGGKSTSTARMYQTIVPFAVKYNLDINTKYDVEEAEKLVKSIEKKSGTVLLVWEHKAIKRILKALGFQDPPSWDDRDFDTMLIITFQNGKPVLNKDKENIKPENNCR